MEPATGDLVVATYNVRNAFGFDGRHVWPLRRRATAAMLRLLDADVVGLQEAYGFQLRHLLRAGAPGHEAVGEGRDGDGRGERCPVLARRSRLAPVSHRTRWFGRPDGTPGRAPGARFPRIGTVARYVDRTSGRTLGVVNVHLDADHHALRVASVEELVGWLPADDGVVVLGDFNTDDAGCLAPLVAAGLRPALGPDAPGTSPGFAARRDGVRLDHVFVGGALRTSAAEVVRVRPGGRMASDHWPVRAELAWASA